MLIPRSIASIAKCASKESGRYNFNGILLERRADGTPIAVATDGRRLMSVTWPETTAGEYPPVADLSQDHVENFRTIMPAAALGDISKSAKLSSGLKNKPALNNVLLCEPSANGHLKIGATNIAACPTTTVSSIEGNFPPYADVIPSYTFQEKPAEKFTMAVGDRKITSITYTETYCGTDGAGGEKCYSDTVHEGLPFTAVRIAVNPKLLAELILAMAEAVGENPDNKGVILEIPVVPYRPIKVTSRSTNGIVATGVLMPVNADL